MSYAFIFIYICECMYFVHVCVHVHIFVYVCVHVYMYGHAPVCSHMATICIVALLGSLACLKKHKPSAIIIISIKGRV